MQSHPYFPPHADIRGYTPNTTPLLLLLGAFAAIIGTVLFVTDRLAATYSRRPLRRIDRFSVWWFALCGFLHVFFEGYFITHGSRIPGMDTLFAQLWKEYTLSDSRYLASDIFTVCVETITVVAWGPLSWLTVLAIVRASPLRHAGQIIVCVAHLYGVALYYLTCETEYWWHGVSYSRPEPMYYWVYYAGFNAPWVVVPFVLMYDSLAKVSEAFRALEEKESARKRR